MIAWIAVAPGYRAAVGASEAAPTAAVVGGAEEGGPEEGGAEEGGAEEGGAVEGGAEAGAENCTSESDTEPSCRDELDGANGGEPECLATADRWDAGA